MSVCVAVTDSPEGRAAFTAGVQEALALGLPLVAVNLTGSDLDTSEVDTALAYEVVVPDGPGHLDEVEQVERVLAARPEISRLVVGVRRRSAVGKLLLGSIAQRLILEAQVPVLAVKGGPEA